eukprot:TRINITY_DN27496_c0_g1_i1.p1 TRINITY_DN27496_c0_g1~~TRINITY_DN27496_c0_g1_i1.p1  ORF type:complete len:205 (+),score=34.15 TRINITY_DN27496_c0_g1_i1:94-708(+)
MCIRDRCGEASQGASRGYVSAGRISLKSRDPLSAIRWFRKGCWWGCLDARYELARVLISSGAVVSGVQALREAAVGGHAPAQHRLGYYLLDQLPAEVYAAIVTEHTSDRAGGMFELAAQQGFLPSMEPLSRCLETGEGCAKDIIKAFEWILVAQQLAIKHPTVISASMQKRVVAASVRLAGSLAPMDVASCNLVAQHILETLPT